MRLIQHKREAYWFYRFLSLLYDRWINPLFWTPAMRKTSLRLARLDDQSLLTVDVGAGTGFTSEGIVEHVAPERVTLLDQSPHQLARAAAKPSLSACHFVRGDAEALPFATDGFDRYVSAGSVEYWPQPELAIAEAYRVLRPGGIALLVGPLPPAGRVARWLADVWMLFPRERDYGNWFATAGFTAIRSVHVAPEWHRDARAPYGLAIAGTKPVPGPSPLASAKPRERLDQPMTPIRWLRFAVRFVIGSAAGAAFVPIAALLALRERLRRRR
jgi:MPBQ/MSBQ methyltransferase